MSEREALERFIGRLPKVELHVHLEGAIQPRTLLRLARRRNVDLPATSEEGLREFFEFRDFEHFVEVYLLCSRCLRDPEDFQLVVEDFLAEQERQHVHYTEAYLTISTHMANGVNAAEVADALRESIRDGERRRGVRLRVIPDIVRNVARERADQTLEWAIANREGLVVALGLAGMESSPSEPFREHFAEAERVGLGRVAHAGEQTSADDVSRVLAGCRPQRIGHGIRAIDDEGVLGELVASGVPLEISPTSNVRLGYCEDLESHPIAELHRAGVRWSVNSDDPALFGTDLDREYLAVAETLGLSASELGDLALAALEQSFLPETDKGELRRRMELEIGLALEAG